jgi:acetyl-CoA synthetase
MTGRTTSTQGFLEARDLLLRHRTDYERAYREFAWPVLGEFNWALDYFDVIAQSNDNPALWIVDDPAGEGTKYSYAQMSERSARMANFLRGIGVGRGDRLLLMLPNRVELWDVMVAAMKLGAIVLPATTQLSADDVRDRVQIGEAKFVVVDSAELAKFDGLEIPLTRISVGTPREGWIDLAAAYEATPQFTPDGPTHATDPLLLYFTSGTTSKPKLVEHTHQSYPVGHLSTMYWIGLQPPGAAFTRRGMRRPACSSSTTRASCRRKRSTCSCAARSRRCVRPPRSGACWCRSHWRSIRSGCARSSARASL